MSYLYLREGVIQYLGRRKTVVTATVANYSIISAT